MATIKYKMADGQIVDVEVNEDFKREYEKMECDEKRINYKERRRHISLDMLIEIEEQENRHGSLHNKSLNKNQDTFSLVSSELDPLEIYMQKEEDENKPLMKALSSGLTDYQRKIAIDYYICNKTQTQIAEELGTSRTAVHYVIKKIQKKVLADFV